MKIYLVFEAVHGGSQSIVGAFCNETYAKDRQVVLESKNQDHDDVYYFVSPVQLEDTR